MLARNALVVDDSRTARMVLKSQLTQFDVTVESAPDGGQALDLLRDLGHIPDVIFLDHVMPGLDGFQVLARLKQDQATRNIPVVMYTSQAAPQYIKEAKSLGAIAVIPKNVSDEELADALDKAELYRLTAANDDFAGVANNETAASELTDQPETAVPALTAVSTETASPGALSGPRSAAGQPEAADYVATGSSSNEAQALSSAVHTSQHAPPRAVGSSGLVLILLALLTFAQGYAMLRDQQHVETISSLQQQLNQQQVNHQNQLSQQNQMLPDLRNQIASQQYQLDEIMLQQMSMLFTLLKEKPAAPEPVKPLSDGQAVETTALE
ncbi:MAG: response regulator [Halioglobus sp.]